MLHAVITGLIHYDLLSHRFKRVKVNLCGTSPSCRLALTTSFRVVTKNVNALTPLLANPMT